MGTDSCRSAEIDLTAVTRYSPAQVRLALALGHRPFGAVSVCLGRVFVTGSDLTCRERGEVRAHQLGAWLSHMEPCSYDANRWRTTGHNVAGELLDPLGL